MPPTVLLLGLLIIYIVISGKLTIMIKGLQGWSDIFSGKRLTEGTNSQTQNNNNPSAPTGTDDISDPDRPVS